MHSKVPLFELEGVSFSIHGSTLLAPLNLSLRSQCILGLIGPNGSGKSTLMKVLARQQPPSTGTVYLKGRALSQWNDREFARKVAYLPQHTPTAPGMLVKELVALGRYPWHGALGRLSSRDHDRIEEAIELTEIAPFAHRLVDTLSGGERQRVWLAMLIAQDTECLLLDEPISALDVAHQVEVLSLVQRLSRSQGCTAVIVLHDVNMAAHYCDELLAIRTGQLIAHGPADGIMTASELERIYGTPMDVMQHPSSGRTIAVAR